MIPIFVSLESLYLGTWSLTSTPHSSWDLGQSLHSKESLGLRRSRCRNKACDANKEEHDECGPNEKPLAVHPNTWCAAFFFLTHIVQRGGQWITFQLHHYFHSLISHYISQSNSLILPTHPIPDRTAPRLFFSQPQGEEDAGNRRVQRCLPMDASPTTWCWWLEYNAACMCYGISPTVIHWPHMHGCATPDQQPWDTFPGDVYSEL